MKHLVSFFLLTMLLAGMGAWAQNHCPQLHNPTTFSAMVSDKGKWSARVGDRVQDQSGGSTGYNVLSTCSRPSKPPIVGHTNITSATYNSGYDDNRCACNHCSLFDGHDQRFRIYTSADAGLDLFTVNNTTGQGMQRIPQGHATSIRLGDMRATGTCQNNINSNGNDKGAEALFYTMLVTPFNALLFIDYAIVACRYDHDPWQAGEFLIRVCKKNGDQWQNAPINDSLWFNVAAPHVQGGLPEPWVAGFTGSPQSAGATSCTYCYKPWARVAISLIDFLYDSVRIEMYTSDCIYNVDPIYAYIAGSCQKMQISSSGCPIGVSDAIDTLHAPAGLLTYDWYVSSTGYDGPTTNTDLMSTLNFRSLQSYDSILLVRTDHFITSMDDLQRDIHAGDTVGTTTYKCIMTSAMDPEKPFHSTLYAQVSNIKPIINATITEECLDTSVLTMIARGRVPFKGANAPEIDHSLTRWEVHQGSDPLTPIDTVMYGDTAYYHSANAGYRAVVLTMYLEDSACSTTNVYVAQVHTPPTTRVEITKRTICEGETTTLTDLTEGIVERRWVFADTTISSEVSGLSATTSVTRDFTEFKNPFMLITKGDADCYDTLFDIIYFFHDPKVSYTEDTIICNGHESHVKVSTDMTGVSFAWYRHKDQEGEEPICRGDVLYVRPTQPRTTYYLKITADAGCVAWDSVTLSLLSTKIIPTPRSAKHCPGDSVTLRGEGAMWYEWSSYPPDPNLEEQKHNQTITVSPSEDTRYFLVGYAADSCDIAAIEILVKEIPLPIIEFEYSPQYIDTETPVVNFSDLSQYSDHSQWIFGDGAVSTGQNVTHHFDIYATGCNTVTLRSFNELGCSVDSSWTIVIDTFGFFRPNIFTPNKATNNVFSIISKSNMDKFHIAIFNRRGALVFTSDDINFKWDGTHDGTPCPQGAYPYVITYTRQGSVQEYRVKGTVTLIR